MQIRLDASDLPGRSCRLSPDSPRGYLNVHVGVQRRDQRDGLLGLVAGGASSATWFLGCNAVPSPTGIDLKGPYIQGPPGGRFIYLAWGTVDDAQNFTLFRRAKVWLDAIAPIVIARAGDQGVLVGRLGLTDRTGNPLCGAVRPPLIAWSAEHAG